MANQPWQQKSAFSGGALPGQDNNSKQQFAQPMGQMNQAPNAQALQAMMPAPAPRAAPQLPQPRQGRPAWMPPPPGPGQGIPTSMPTPPPQVLANMLQVPGGTLAGGAQIAAQQGGSWSGGKWYPTGADQSVTAVKPAGDGYQDVPQTEFGSSLQQQIQDYFGTPAGIDPEVIEKMKAEATMGIGQEYGQQQSQLAQQLAARGLGYGGAFLTGATALASGEAMAKAKAVNDLNYKAEMARLQDEAQRLQAMMGMYGAESDNVIQIKLAEIAEKIKLAEFSWNQSLSKADLVKQMIAEGVSAQQMEAYLPGVSEFLETGVWPATPTAAPDAAPAPPQQAGAYLGQQLNANGAMWEWDGAYWQPTGEPPPPPPLEG